MSRTIRALSATFVLTSAAAWPSLGLAQDAPGASQQPNAGYTQLPPTKEVDIPVQEPNAGPNVPMLATGTVLFAGPFVASTVVAGQHGRPDDNNLYYPIAGPWMDYAQRNCAAFPCSNENLDKALLILDGIGQGVGAALMVASLFVPNGHHFLTIGSREQAGPKVTFTPSHIGLAGYGIGAVGVF